MHGCNSLPPIFAPATGKNFAPDSKQLQVATAWPCPLGSVPAHPRLHSHFKTFFFLLKGIWIPHPCLEQGAWAQRQPGAGCAPMQAAGSRAGAQQLPSIPQPGMFRDVLLQRLKTNINLFAAFCTFPLSLPFSLSPSPALAFLIKLQASIMFS